MVRPLRPNVAALLGNRGLAGLLSVILDARIQNGSASVSQPSLSIGKKNVEDVVHAYSKHVDQYRPNERFEGYVVWDEVFDVVVSLPVDGSLYALLAPRSTHELVKERTHLVIDTISTGYRSSFGRRTGG